MNHYQSIYRTAASRAIALGLLASSAHAVDVPQSLSFQAFLTDRAGDPVNDDVEVTFYLYRQASGGAAIFRETQNVFVERGILILGIGDVTPLSYADLDPTNGDVYVEVIVNGDVLGPRFKLRSVAYAMCAANALSEDDIRAALADNLAPSGCAAGQTITWGPATATWGCADVGTGPTGPAGESVQVAVEPPGGNCADGGVAATVGGTTNHVCNGLPAEQSVIVDELPGANCTYGGIKVTRAGTDSFICNGTDGVAGESVAIAPEPTGTANCAGLGGVAFTVGGTTEYACNGAEGAKGDQGDKGDPGDSVVITTEAPDAATCPDGGVRLEVAGGTPTYVCNGPQGPVGAVGPKGDQGDVGPIGPTGPKGDQGDVGPKGDQGDVGAIGPIGPAGPIGPIGPQGDPGDSVMVASVLPDPGTCATGGVSVQVGMGAPTYVCDGDVGPVGPKGDTGDTGDTGPIGPEG